VIKLAAMCNGVGQRRDRTADAGLFRAGGVRTAALILLGDANMVPEDHRCSIDCSFFSESLLDCVIHRNDVLKARSQNRSQICRQGGRMRSQVPPSKLASIRFSRSGIKQQGVAMYKPTVIMLEKEQLHALVVERSDL